jgi:hypothetical protein
MYFWNIRYSTQGRWHTKKICVYKGSIEGLELLETEIHRKCAEYLCLRKVSIFCGVTHDGIAHVCRMDCNGYGASCGGGGKISSAISVR